MKKKTKQQTISGLSSLKEMAADIQAIVSKPETAKILSEFIGNIESMLNKIDSIIDLHGGIISENDILKKFNPVPVEKRIDELIDKTDGSAVIKRNFRTFVDYRIAIAKIIFDEYGSNRYSINGLAKMLRVDRASVYHYKNMTIYPEIKMIINELLNTQHNENKNK